ncbi:prenylated Rab acceptor protein 1 [Budorcas taxicolor]|uniref:prenylated Rab acceptor protein 1 n=1 Tax=Budorcas taxicolor TaxID=37181 RepID=UPI002283CFD2|nr:prenylated Rab acceptor protein 1 [Budorcas taxicolor]
MLGSRTTVPQRLQNDYTSAPALLSEAVLGRGPRGLQSPGLVSSSPDNTDMAAEKDQQKDAEAEGLSAATLLPKLIPSGAGREWLERRRATIRSWGSFVDQRRFSRPRNLGELCQRLVRNVEYYQSNYVFVFLGLILYCVATSPMLLVALAVFFGACYILYLRTLQSKFVLFGREVSPAHQYALAGGVSFPFFWLAGAGSAVFWVLGATLVVIGSHAAFHQMEAVDGEELQMEPV